MKIKEIFHRATEYNYAFCKKKYAFSEKKYAFSNFNYAKNDLQTIYKHLTHSLLTGFLLMITS
ncbi:hypothetical protein BOO26_19415 [Vibrio navarrensis]|nr:hypothetical protein [Vibrio navarrensis]